MHLIVDHDPKGLKAILPEDKKLASQKGGNYPFQTMYEITFRILVVLYIFFKGKPLKKTG